MRITLLLGILLIVFELSGCANNNASTSTASTLPTKVSTDAN